MYSCQIYSLEAEFDRNVRKHMQKIKKLYSIYSSVTWSGKNIETKTHLFILEKWRWMCFINFTWICKERAMLEDKVNGREAKIKFEFEID